MEGGNIYLRDAYSIRPEHIRMHVRPIATLTTERANEFIVVPGEDTDDV